MMSIRFRKINSLAACIIFYLHTSPINAQTTPDPGIMGPYTVLTAEYNLGELVFKPEDFPDFVEVRGSVHYPSALSDGPFPVLFFLHGRHETCYKTTNPDNTNQDWPCAPGFQSITSFQGYDYLAQLMASNGYIVISISCNAINATDNSVGDYGMAARAELLQYHLNLWNTYNTIGGTPFDSLFIGKLDMNNIGTMGHSRGGEGVVANALLNKSLGSPYGINAVLALAPVDFLREVLTGIPFMNVAPYCDGDVSDLQGVHYYDDARYAVADDEAPKHSVLFLGANHNFFNTVWTPGEYIAGTIDDWDYTGGDSDTQCGMGVPGSGRLNPADQQAAFAAYAGAFFRYYIGNEKQFAPILNVDDIIPPASSTLDSSEVFVSYHAPDSLRLDINETYPGNDITNSLADTVANNSLINFNICGGGLGEPDCGISFYFGKVPHEGNIYEQGLYQQSMEWNDTADWYENELPPAFQDITKYKNLVFRAAVNFTTSPLDQNLNFTVQLIDSSGTTSSQAVSDNSNALFYQPGTVYWDLPKALFNTIKIPLRNFSGIDLKHVQKIRFLFNKNPAGAILISDVALSGRQGKIKALENLINIASTVVSVPYLLASDVLLYPNPSNDYFIIENKSGEIEIKSIKIFTMFGILIQEIYNYKNTEINISSLPAGIYVVTINDIAKYKLIKE